MKTSTLVTTLLCLTVSVFGRGNALAEGADPKVLSEACERLSGEFRIKFKGQSFLSSLLSYELVLNFPQGKKGVKFSTDWGVDVSEEADFEALTDSWIEYASTFPSQQTRDCNADPERCLSSLNNDLNYFKVAQTHLVSGQPDVEAKRKALDCASERVRLFAYKVRTEVLQLRNLSSPR